MRKVFCPVHEEDTPSCEVYADHAHCFGCGWRGKPEDVGLRSGEVNQPEPEDLEKAFAYIDALPKRLVRGLFLPSDDHSYFIAWPGRDYFKRRFTGTGKGPKYVGARGHTKPVFWAQAGVSDTLVIVEGEINALSIAKCCPELDVMSPGGSGDFGSQTTKAMLPYIVRYSTILVLADRDGPGTEACINMISLLASRGKAAKAHLMEIDANDLLTSRGSAETRAEVFKRLGRNLEEGAG